MRSNGQVSVLACLPSSLLAAHSPHTRSCTTLAELRDPSSRLTLVLFLVPTENGDRILSFHIESKYITVTTVEIHLECPYNCCSNSSNKKKDARLVTSIRHRGLLFPLWEKARKEHLLRLVLAAEGENVSVGQSHSPFCGMLSSPIISHFEKSFDKTIPRWHFKMCCV